MKRQIESAGEEQGESRFAHRRRRVSIGSFLALLLSIPASCGRFDEAEHRAGGGGGPGTGGFGTGGTANAPPGAPSGGTPPTAHGDGGSEGEQPVFDPRAPWPPPYMIYTWGTSSARKGIAIAVDDRFVYWWEYGSIMQLLKDGSGERKEFVLGQDCSWEALVAADGYVFSICSRGLLRLNPRTAEQEFFPAYGSHLALALDDHYFYSAAHGCRLLARYHRDTLELDSYVDLPTTVMPRTGGTTYLSIQDGRLLCSAPDNALLGLDEWGTAPRELVSPRNVLASDLQSDTAYWSQRENLIGAEGEVCAIPFAGGTAQCAPDGDGSSKGLLAFPETGQVLIGVIDGLKVLSPTDPTFSRTIKYGRPNFFVRDESYVYSTGLGNYWLLGEPAATGANIIARVPLTDLQPTE